MSAPRTMSSILRELAATLPARIHDLDHQLDVLSEAAHLSAKPALDGEELRRFVCALLPEGLPPTQACLIALWMITRAGRQAAPHGVLLLEDLSKQGCLAASYYLAQQKLLGRWTTADPDGARMLLEHVAQKAQDAELRALAQAWMGDLYRTGRGGIPYDASKAVAHYEAAALDGNAGAAYNLGRFYDVNGSGPWRAARPQLTKAASYYGMAAQAGFVPAMAAVGWLHAIKIVPQADEAFGRQMLRKAAAEGHKPAAELLRILEQFVAAGGRFADYLHEREAPSDSKPPDEGRG